MAISVQNSHFWVFLAYNFQMPLWIFLIFGMEVVLMVFFKKIILYMPGKFWYGEILATKGLGGVPNQKWLFCFFLCTFWMASKIRLQNWKIFVRSQFMDGSILKITGSTLWFGNFKAQYLKKPKAFRKLVFRLVFWA